MTFWRQAREIARKDLRTEIRTGEVFFVTIPFGAVALMLIPLAIGTDAPLLRDVGPGMYWVVILLFGVLVALRQSGVDEGPQLDVLGLLGVDPAARFVGRAGATTLRLLAFELALGPVALALYDPAPKGWGWIAVLIPMVAIGLGLLGTLAATIAASIASSALVPLLVAPLSVPILLAAAQTMEGLALGNTIVGWILLLLIMDLLLAVAGVLSARPLQEASR
jgi:heme exporter protein B